MIERMSIDVKLQDGIKFSQFQIEFNKLSVIVGMNSAGKSLIMKFAWFVGYTLQMYKLSYLLGLPDWEKKFVDEVNDVFKYSFSDPEFIDGFVEITDKNREIYSYLIEVKSGELKRFNLDIINKDKFDIGKITSVRYASRNTRTFLAYKNYINLKELLNISNLLDKSNLEKLCKVHPLYDVLWFEGIKNILDDYIKNGVADDIQAGISDLFFMSVGRSDDAEKFIGFDHGNEPGEIVMLFDNGRREKLSKMSDGTQSMVMMFFFGVGAS